MTKDSVNSSEYLSQILRAKVYDVVRKTPTQVAQRLSSRYKNKILVKREDLQPIFSFKCRGAANLIAKGALAGDKSPVIAASAGNHAQGVALAAKYYGIEATIVMPQTAPELKVTSVENLGANVILHGETFEEAEQYANKLASETNYKLIPPYDNIDIICGQGTVAAEILQDYPADIDAIFIPVGGGGLLAGMALYCKAVRPEIKVIGVEPEDAACTAAAIKANARVKIPHVGLFADGVAVSIVGETNWPIIRDLCDSVITVSTDQICASVQDLFDDFRVVAEPAGALATAGLDVYLKESGVTDKTFVTVLSGANTNFARLAHIVERAEFGSGKEKLFAVKIPERKGSFSEFAETLGYASITEFNYRFGDPKDAWTFVGVLLNQENKEVMRTNLEAKGFVVIELTRDEVSKSHLRHLVGGRPPRSEDLSHERIFSIELPARPKALRHFLSLLADEWNISLFHYRNHSSAYCRILVGFNDMGSKDDLNKKIEAEGGVCIECTENPAISAFLR